MGLRGGIVTIADATENGGALTIDLPWAILNICVGSEQPPQFHNR